MNCKETIERLGEHLDRMLPEAEAAGLEAHLASCASCRTEMEQLRRAIDAVKSLPRVRAPRGFAAGVMAEIRSESAVASAGPVRVTPIRSAAVFMRLAASIAAVCLVWVGVRALRVEPAGGSVPGIQATSNQPMREGKAGDSFEKTNNAGDLAKAGKEKARGIVPEGVAPKPEAPDSSTTNPPPAPADMKDAAGTPGLASRKGAHGSTENGAWSDPSQALAVQRITVFSNDVAVDTSQLKKLLSESGYTYSTQKKAILVRVPASEAARLVASLGSMPGGFRAADRQSLEALERLKAREEEKSKSDKGGMAGDSADGLSADADDLKEALRKHIDESRKEIQKQEEGKKLAESAENKAKAPAEAPKVTAGAGGGSKGKAQEYGEDKRAGAKDSGLAEGGERDGNEEALGAGVTGNEPAGPMVAGGRPRGEAEKKAPAKQDDGAEQGAGKSDPRADGSPATGGTDEMDGRARREKELGDKLSDELKKLESDRKVSDSEDAVVIYIEIEETPAAK
jgi:anti-sigma factor RsiW